MHCEVGKISDESIKFVGLFPLSKFSAIWYNTANRMRVNGLENFDELADRPAAFSCFTGLGLAMKN